MKIPVLDKDIQLIIPTHMRTELKKQKTWLGLPDELRAKTLVITSTKEDMKALRRNLDHEHVYAINDPSVDGIAKKRQWLIENIKADFIFQMDDDLTFQHRCSTKYREYTDKGWKVKQKYADKVKFIEIEKFTAKHQMVSWNRFFNRILDGRYAHGGLGVRMGNNNVEDEIKYATRAMQCIFHHRKTLLKKGIRFDDVKFREDFHVTLCLLKRGYPNIVHQGFIVNPEPFGKVGGCFDERTIEASNKQAYKLAKKHEPFVKAVERKYSNSESRVEVICYWQKAYNSAKRQDRRV